MGRPDREHYYLGLAVAAAGRAECRGLKVGAVLVKANRVLATGYNGAPEGGGNCSEGGVCPRCDGRSDDPGHPFSSGNGYDKCICVHAEANAVAAAARYGIAIDGATAYVTHQPCLLCAKELVQSGVDALFYAIQLPLPAFADDPELTASIANTHARLMGQLKAKRLEVSDVLAAADLARSQFAAAAA